MAHTGAAKELVMMELHVAEKAAIENQLDAKVVHGELRIQMQGRDQSVTIALRLDDTWDVYIRKS